MLYNNYYQKKLKFEALAKYINYNIIDKSNMSDCDYTNTELTTGCGIDKRNYTELTTGQNVITPNYTELTIKQNVIAPNYTDNEIVEIFNLKASELKKELVAIQHKADSLLKEAKDAQTEADKLKTRLKIMSESAEQFKNTLTPEITITEKPIEKLYKVVIVGDIGTGKTSIIKRNIHDIFSMHYKSTIGVDFALKVMKSNDITYRLQMWDLAGQERFGNMTRVYYKEAIAAFVVFDITRESTLEAIIKWKSDIDNKVTLPNSDDPIPVILLANKSDLNDDDKYWEEKSKELDEICNTHKFLSWYKVSAKDNINIESAMNELLLKIIEIDS